MRGSIVRISTLLVLGGCSQTPTVRSATLVEKQALLGDWRLAPTELSLAFDVAEHELRVITDGASSHVLPVRTHVDVVRCYDGCPDREPCELFDDSTRPWSERDYVEAQWPDSILSAAHRGDQTIRLFVVEYCSSDG